MVDEHEEVRDILEFYSHETIQLLAVELPGIFNEGFDW